MPSVSRQIIPEEKPSLFDVNNLNKEVISDPNQIEILEEIKNSLNTIKEQNNEIIGEEFE